MPACAREQIVADGEVGVYHCVSRCVRRAFLCGKDALTGKSFEHRKDWVRDRLVLLAEAFAIDVCGYAVMSNHLHLVLRTRPDLAGAWSDEEVARRWWKIFPGRRDPQGNAAEPTDEDLRPMLLDADRLKERRERLSSLSWFMRCVCEFVARKANREDRCTGRFWEGRFKSQALLDESAALACLAYVDLNPIRAGVAKTPETSKHTSVHDRIHDRRTDARSSASGRGLHDASNARKPSAKRSAGRAGTQRPPRKADWLCRIGPDRRGTGERPGRSGKQGSSLIGLLSIGLDDYLKLLDWTGRQIRSDKRGSIPSQLAPILDRLQVRPERWLTVVRHFGRWFRQAAGRPDQMTGHASAEGKRWLHGLRASRLAFT